MFYVLEVVNEPCPENAKFLQLCFCYMDSTITLLPVSEISSFLSSSVAAQVSLCQTWLETLKTRIQT